MSRFAILRTQKLKTNTAIRGSLKHAFREQETLNADGELTAENEHLKAENSEQAMRNIQALLPDKIRKNGVRVIEYLITGSGEAINEKTRAEQNAYFSDAQKWLEDKHGADNVAYVGIHRDETTPHMYAYVVPLDDKGKLNARAFLGGTKHVMEELQTDFAEKVGTVHGLDRGRAKSKAKHTSIKEYYARVNDSEKAGHKEIMPPEPKLTEKKRSYGFRVARAVVDELAPQMKKDRAKANEFDTVNQAKNELEGRLERQSRALKSVTEDRDTARKFIAHASPERFSEVQKTMQKNEQTARRHDEKENTQEPER